MSKITSQLNKPLGHPFYLKISIFNCIELPDFTVKNNLLWKILQF